MEVSLLLVQIVNGLQVDILLFLVASDLTLVFTILDVINLAHGALFMGGAYVGAVTMVGTGSLVLSLIAAPIGAFLVGIVLDRLVLRWVYARDHLDQVLVTFGVSLLLNESCRGIFGSAAYPHPVPRYLDWSLVLPGGMAYPAWRLAIIVAGSVVAIALAVTLKGTRFGMLVRSAATNALMLEMLIVDVRRLFLWTFASGAALASFACAMAGPIIAIQPGMGDAILIMAFGVIVTAGTGSVRGGLAGSNVLGLADTLGRSFLTDLAWLALPPAAAAELGPGMSSMLVYILMVAVLLLRP